MIYDNIQAKGTLSIELFDAEGNLKNRIDVNNLVVTVGRYYIAQRMINLNQPTAMSHMAIGSSSTAPAAGDTALGTQLGARVALTGGAGTVAANSNSVIYSATFGAGVGTGVVREAGIFNDLTAGVMLARTTFGDITKEANDSLAITWTVSING